MQQARTTEITNKDPEASNTLLDNLRRTADEIRVRLHLAGMEAKDAWGKLEPKLHEYEQKAVHAKDKLVEGLSELGDELKEQMARLLARLDGKDDKDGRPSN